MKGIQNMKRVIAVLLSMMLLCTLTACSEPAAQPSNATTDAVADTTTEAADDTTAAADTTADSLDVEEGFSFTFEGVELIPGQSFDASALPAPQSVYQVPSCAIEGTDNVYNYGTIEVTAFNDGTGEVIYSVYIVDANTPTNEGLYIGDTVDHVIAAYGEDYTRENGQITYQKGDTLLIMILDGEYVLSIDFRWDT